MTTADNAPSPTRLKLHFSIPFRSLKELPDIELPRLTILTGVNGVGKTHFLTAISQGAIAVEGITASEIFYFDWSSLYNLSSTKVERNHVRPLHSDLRREIASARREYGPTLAAALSRRGVTECTDPWVALRSHPALWTVEAIAKIIANAANHVLSVPKAKKLGYIFKIPVGDVPFMLLEDSEIAGITQTHSVGGQAMQISNLGKVMMSYSELELFNKLCVLDQSEGRTPELPPKTTAEFRAIHGPPPWELLSQILQMLGLDFEIPGPRSYTVGSFKPVIYKRSTGEEIDLKDLSSGEKMLMALAVSTYASTTHDIRTNNKTKLVLLDEIDAPLHPSMARTMLSIIQETLVKRLGCAVILATHSPTTVAIAPEESIHVMRPERSGVKKVSREEAVRLLTAELPTLSLDFSGRRQIFVESDYDAQRYERLYQAYKDRLDSPFSLSFIGIDSDGGKQGGGCAAVKGIVRALRKFGNRSVWGLIDWDSTNGGNEHVLVLARGRRYAIENCLLDPLLVVALVFDAGSAADLSKLGITADDRMEPLLMEERSARRQELIEKVQQRVLGDNITAQDETLPVAYDGGFTHRVSRAYLHHQGHDLAGRVFAAFKSLNRNGNEEKLLERSVEILRHRRALMPTDLLKALQRLASPTPSDPALD